MSISKIIIFGTDREVAEYLGSAQVKLDELDEYGYTPLVQTAIVNSPRKAQLLLAAGASVDFPDLTGRTALFWAADNGNIELCKLLLEHKANPNAYSNGGQSVLVMPLLKKQETIKRLLVNAGAKTEFAQDFTNAKLLGHSFELEGRIDIVDTNNTFIEVELEGFYLRHTLEIITQTLIDFRNNFGSKELRKYFSKLAIIIRSLQVAIKLLSYQDYLIDNKNYLSKINPLLDFEPLIIPIAFSGHAVTFIKLWDWLIRCDRGEFGKENGTVIFYTMDNPSRLNSIFCRDLLYKRQYKEFINTGFIDYLGLTPKWTLPLPAQVTGNCSWANVEAIVPAMLFLLLLEEVGDSVKNCEQEAMNFYQTWSNWNKTRALDFCWQSFQEADAARKAAKAALLGAILFQECDYHNEQDLARANKILAILKQPPYNSILKNYITVFKQDNPISINLKNIYNFLDDSGINVG